MRFRSFLPIVAIVALIGVIVAFDAGLGIPGLAPTASAQEGAVVMSYDHVEIPFFGDWVSSGHADLTAEAWTRWNGDDPAVVPARCAKCHSSAGNFDFVGADGTAAGSIEAESFAPGVLQCTNCHNDATLAQDSVTMPSGAVLTDLGREAVCMNCHQGRASGPGVAASIENAGVDADTVMEGQGFINIHYFAAAATRYGSEAAGGYQYPGKSYEPFFEHVSEFNTCQSCHDPHALELEVAECATCHWGVETVEDVYAIRMPGSLVDYDGDGSTTTGIKTEIENLEHLLLATLQTYAREVVGTPIGYNPASHPYFFVDDNGDGVIGEGESTRYNAFTPRSLAAAYNYQVVHKDPGGFAHNAKYLIQLMYDSIEDLNAALGGGSMAGLVRPGDGVLAVATPEVGLRGALAELQISGHMAAGIRRNDAGHFDATAEAFRHWDEDGAVSASCATCHSADGLPFFIEHGTQIEQEVAQGMKCTTCHVAEGDFTLIEKADVTFPSGAVLAFGTSADNLCATCHQGRASTNTVNARIGTTPDDTVGERLGFVNVHYFSAAASRFGGEAMGAYQYAGKEYVGYFPHDVDFASCTQCHDVHTGEIQVASCADCHGGETLADVRDYRMFDGDYDGDGDADEGTYHEIQGMLEVLYAAMQQYAVATTGNGIAYNSASYPYFFTDVNGDGMADAEEAVRANQFSSWTPRLLRAAYNYQYGLKDPGSYAHNGQYVVQVLFDSIEDLGVDVSMMTRPSNPF